MFKSNEDLTNRLKATGYFIDPVMIKVVYLAARMQKPLLLEGPAGSGKTQLAVSVAKAAGTHIERLQCYRGVTEDQAIGKFDEGLQRLYMEFARGEHADWQSVQASLKGRDFFRAGPLMRALECERPCVLLLTNWTRWTRVSRQCCLRSFRPGSCRSLSSARSKPRAFLLSY